jgi:hypothetical protein
MQEHIAYEQGYLDGLRFIFTLGGNQDLPKEIWDRFADEIAITNKNLRELREEVE